MNNPVALAIFAHPDDIEFNAAGTLLLLKQAGWSIHYFNVSSGDLGSTIMDREETARKRLEEARAAAAILGAEHHPPISNDLAIAYDEAHLKKLAALIRQTSPSIVLTHALSDYMEDHMITARLAVTAAFAKGMPNYVTDPPVAPTGQDIVVYHAPPHGLRGPMRQRVRPGLYVDISLVHSTKRQALAAHESQQSWLETTQGMNSYLASMDQFSETLGRLSGRFSHAEGWDRHLHLGFSETEKDTLVEVLGTLTWVDLATEAAL